MCYECGRKTRQWVDISLAIYLCLNCSALYKEASEDVKIKCINADPWSPEELRYLKNGGNRKLREFLSNYEMQAMTYKERLRTKAISYYRTLVSLFLFSFRRNSMVGKPPWLQIQSQASSLPKPKKLSQKCRRKRSLTK